MTELQIIDLVNAGKFKEAESLVSQISTEDGLRVTMALLLRAFEHNKKVYEKVLDKLG